MSEGQRCSFSSVVTVGIERQSSSHPEARNFGYMSSNSCWSSVEALNSVPGDCVWEGSGRWNSIISL